MSEKSPYQVIKHQHVTEKTLMLQQLKTSESNPSVARCKSPKYVFVVDKKAKKQEIAKAIEKIHNVKVVSVNTINVKQKRKAKRGRGRPGAIASFKKAIVTLDEKDNLDNI